MPNKFIKTSLLCFATAMLAACAQTPVASDADRALTPMQAIQYAAENPRGGYAGIFAVTVQASGQAGGKSYLNSEKDYRDQRNLSIELTPEAVTELKEQFGKTPDELVSSRILVTGVASRVKINIYDQGVKLSTYYFQTHVVVNSVKQIRIL